MIDDGKMAGLDITYPASEAAVARSASPTPGPWTHDGEFVWTSMKDARSEHPNGRICIAHVMTEKPMRFPGVDNGRLDLEGEANARLIAAAPRLLAELQDLCQAAEHALSGRGKDPAARRVLAQVAAARAAIAEATR